MIQPLALGLLAAILAGPVRRRLLRARWLERAPRAGIALWQAFAVSVGTAVLGAGVALTTGPEAGTLVRRLGGLVVVARGLVAAGPSLRFSQLLGAIFSLMVLVLLSGALAGSAVAMVRSTRRQRALVDLLGTPSPAYPDVVVLDHHLPTAYCLGGLRHRIVVSEGAVGCLDDAALAAVIEHERAHLRSHHHLVLLLFRSLRSALPADDDRSSVEDRVAALLEMAADDRAIKRCGPAALVVALNRLAGPSGEPVPALSAAALHARQRIRRAEDCHRTSRLAAATSVAFAGILLGLPWAALAVLPAR